MSSILPYKGKATEFRRKVERTGSGSQKPPHSHACTSSGKHARAHALLEAAPQLSSRQLMSYTYNSSDIMSTVGF